MMINIGKDVLKRWTKDYNLPINIFHEPYFSYLVDLYDDYFKTKEKLKLLEDTVSKFEGDDKFLTHYYEVRDNVIESIKNTDEFQLFNTEDLSRFNINASYPTNDIYKQSCSNKYFVSIDLVKANFQALKFINPVIVGNTNTYDEFIKFFTELEYMSKSKYLRQVIFGNLNPKRQIKVERFLIEQVISLLLGSECVDKEDICMAVSDELVFEVSLDKAKAFSIESENMRTFIKEQLNIDVDIEVFKLKSIDKKYFAKEFINKDGYELKSIPLIYFPQIYKRYNNIPIVDNDLVFYHEHQLAKFLNPIM